MHFFDRYFPLLVVLHAPHFDELEMQELVAGFEAYFQRDARYSVLTLAPGDSVRMGAKERRLIGEWANGPRVRELSQRLCVGSATVVPSAIARYGMTALLWFWTPVAPHKTVATLKEGLDFCLGRLASEKLALPAAADTVRRELTDHLRGLGGFGPSLG